MDMRWVGRIAASAAIRKVVFIAIAAVFALVGSFFSGQAHATDTVNFTDQGRAYAACMVAAKTIPVHQGMSGGCVPQQVCHYINGLRQDCYHACLAASATQCYSSSIKDFEYPFANSCSSRPPVFVGWAKEGTKTCHVGCEMGVTPTNTRKDHLDIPLSDSIDVSQGTRSPTGAVCATGDQGPPADDYCELLPMGHKICRDKSGKNCVISAKTGRKYCPAPGEKSVSPDRTEGATAANGTNPGDMPENRPGEDFKPGPGATNTASGCQSNCNNGPVTTNIINNGGTPNPGSTPVPGDGSNDPGTGPGDGDPDDEEGEEGSVSGGGDCALPPTCSGDPLLCEQIRQTYFARCEDEGRAAAFSTGVEGADGDDGTDGFSIDDLWSDGDEGEDDELDTAGFGFGTTCPDPPEFFDTVLDLSDFCTLLSAFGLMVFALGGYHSFLILAE